MVYGSRFLNGRPSAPFATIAGNRFLTSVTNVLYGASLTDMETCYKIMRADLARSLDLTSNSFDLEPEITGKLLRRGTRIVELPVQFAPRSKAEGKKIRWRHGFTALCRPRARTLRSPVRTAPGSAAPASGMQTAQCSGSSRNARCTMHNV